MAMIRVAEATLRTELCFDIIRNCDFVLIQIRSFYMETDELQIKNRTERSILRAFLLAVLVS